MAEQKIMKTDDFETVRQQVDAGFPLISVGWVKALLVELDRLQEERDELYSLADEAGLV